MKNIKVIKAFNDQSKLLLDTNKTFKDIFDLSIVRNKHHRAFEYLDDDNKLQKCTYNKVKKDTYKYAAVLSNFLKDKDNRCPVILKLDNSIKWCELLYAIIMNGFAPLLINNKLKKNSVENLISKSKACLIITDDPRFYSIDKVEVNLVDYYQKNDNFIPNWGNDIIFCSSGTTGDVKLMVYSSENLIYQITSALDVYKDSLEIMYPRRYGNLKILAMLPFHHIFGFVAIFLWFTYYGKTIVIPNDTNIKNIQKLCLDRKITHIFSVPLFFDSLAKQFNRRKSQLDKEIVKKIDENIKARLDNKKIKYKFIDKRVKKLLLGNQIRFTISGGGFLSEETSKIINGIGYPLYNGFGMSEIGITSVELSANIKDRIKCSIGKPFRDVKYKIVDGELLVKSPSIHYKEMLNDKLIPVTLDKEGYLATGDIVNKDNDNRYYIKGRKKDIIINSDGENVYPDEIELYFNKLKNVNNLAVLGIKDKTNASKEFVTLVLEISPSLIDKEIKEIADEVHSINNKLMNSAHIEKLYFTKKCLPVSNSIKVKRYKIKEDIENNSNDYFSLITNNVKNTKKSRINNDLLLEIKKIFSDVLILPIEKIKDNSHFTRDLGGDSMLFIELVSQIESLFGITIPSENYLNCMNVNGMASFISNNVK